MRWMGLMLIAGWGVATAFADYRMETDIQHIDGEYITRYNTYDHDVKCVQGKVVLRDGAHVSTQFLIIYKGEVIARIVKTPERDKPKIEILKQAYQREGTYQGRMFIWLDVWDGISRRAPLPGEGHYIIDPDGHVRKPKPEERIAIWERPKR